MNYKMLHNCKLLLFLFLFNYLFCVHVHRLSMNPKIPCLQASPTLLLMDWWSPILVGCTSGLPNSSWELPRVKCQHLIINNYPCVLRFQTQIEKHVHSWKNLCIVFAHITPPAEGAWAECRIGSGNAYFRSGSSWGRNHISFFRTKIIAIFGLFTICAGKSFGERQIYNSRCETLN